jgi:hypothetical protein
MLLFLQSGGGGLGQKRRARRRFIFGAPIRPVRAPTRRCQQDFEGAVTAHGLQLDGAWREVPTFRMAPTLGDRFFVSLFHD